MEINKNKRDALYLIKCLSENHNKTCDVIICLWGVSVKYKALLRYVLFRNAASVTSQWMKIKCTPTEK